MRRSRAFCAALCALLSASARANDAAAEAPRQDVPPVPINVGYAFDRPAILRCQRIFGLAHGVHLLFSACQDKNLNASAVQRAYEEWHAVQAPTLQAVVQALAAHHFGPQATRAGWQDIARTLGLKETVYPSLGEVSLTDACATFPEALTRTAYDFTRRLETEEACHEQ